MAKQPNWEKYPEIWAEFDKAREALKPLMAKRQKLLDERSALGDEVKKLEDRRDALHDKACADIDQISELRSVVGRCAKAMGAVSA